MIGQLAENKCFSISATTLEKRTFATRLYFANKKINFVNDYCNSILNRKPFYFYSSK